MKRITPKNITIKMPQKDAELVREIVKLEERNVEAHRLARKDSSKSEYEKRLEKLNDQFAAAF